MALIFDPIRKKWVSKTPEEQVRQSLILKMVQELGYPPSGIAIEKELSQLPHLQILERSLPRRRIDLLCFASLGGHLHPLLLIECKAVAITDAVLRQVIGYNQNLIQASFVTVANASHTFTARAGPQDYLFALGLPSYEELCSQLQI